MISLSSRVLIGTCFVLLVLWIVFMSLYIHERRNLKYAKTEIEDSRNDNHDNKLFVIKYNVLPESKTKDWNKTVESLVASTHVMEQHLSEMDQSNNFYKYTLRKHSAHLDTQPENPLVCFVVMVEDLLDTRVNSLLAKLKPFSDTVEHLTIATKPSYQQLSLHHFFSHHSSLIQSKYIAFVDVQTNIENNHILYKYQQARHCEYEQSILVWNSLDVHNDLIISHNLEDLSFELIDTWIAKTLVTKVIEEKVGLNITSCLKAVRPDGVMHLDFVLYSRNNEEEVEQRTVEEYVTCNLKGGLGNQLFQIGAVVEYAERYGKTPIFDNRKAYLQASELETKRDTYFKDILSWCPFESMAKLDSGLWSCLVETGFNFEELPHIPGNVVLDGYFQSAQYTTTTIQNTTSNILHHMKRLCLDTSPSLHSKISKLATNTNVAIHIRRTDYIHSDCHISLPMSYYRKSLATIIDKLGQQTCSSISLVFFTDDIQWCKHFLQQRSPISTLMSYFQSFRVHDSSELEPHMSSWFDMYCMSLCTHHIIANSSYSWWANKLSQPCFEAQNGIVIAPKTWFNPTHVPNWDTIYEDYFLVI